MPANDDSEDEDEPEMDKSISKNYGDLYPSFAHLGKLFLRNNKLGRLKRYKYLFEGQSDYY